MSMQLMRAFGLQTLTRVAKTSSRSAGCMLQAIQPARSLHHEEKLGLDRFRRAKQTYLTNRFDSQLRTNFLERVQATVDSTNTIGSVIFTEDVKNMVHLMDNTPEHLELFRKMLTKYAEQGDELRFSNFHFGSLIARVFHEYRNLDELIAYIKNEKIGQLINKELTTFTVALDLAYELGRYQDVLDLYDLYCQHNTIKCPADLTLLIVATYYKMGTQEAFDRAKVLIKSLNEQQLRPGRRTLTFFIHLAYKLGFYESALEALQSITHSNHSLLRNLRTLISAKLGRFDQAIIELNNIVSTPSKFKVFAIKEVLDELRNEAEKQDNSAFIVELDGLVQKLNDANKIATENIEHYLELPSRPMKNRDSSLSTNRFDGPRSYNVSSFGERPPRFQGNNNFGQSNYRRFDNRYNEGDDQDQRRPYFRRRFSFGRKFDGLENE